jgi:hypothetical protein
VLLSHLFVCGGDGERAGCYITTLGCQNTDHYVSVIPCGSVTKCYFLLGAVPLSLYLHSVAILEHWTHPTMLEYRLITSIDLSRVYT